MKNIYNSRVNLIILTLVLLFIILPQLLLLIFMLNLILPEIELLTSIKIYSSFSLLALVSLFFFKSYLDKLIVHPLKNLIVLSDELLENFLPYEANDKGTNEIKLLENRMLSTLETTNSRIESINKINTYLLNKNKELSNLAHIDHLTGLYTRRFFFDYLEDRLNKLTKERVPLSLLMIDVDFFKKFNDKYGHQIGDLVLSNVAKIISSSSREGDCAARYGGEEFIVVLPRTTLEHALLFAERIRNNIANMDLNCIEEKITVSIGISSNEDMFNKDDFLLNDLIYAADLALYDAKKRGKNTICSG